MAWVAPADARRLAAELLLQGRRIEPEVAQQLRVVARIHLLGQLGLGALGEVGVASGADALDDDLLGDVHVQLVYPIRRHRTPTASMVRGPPAIRPAAFSFRPLELPPCLCATTCATWRSSPTWTTARRPSSTPCSGSPARSARTPTSPSACSTPWTSSARRASRSSRSRP